VLVVVAGFVDAVGFLALAGTFVAFMSGNTSAGGALVGALDPARAARQLYPLPLFVAGIYAGTLAVQAVPPEGQHRRYGLVLAAECGLIAVVLGAATAAGIRGAIPLDPPLRFFALAGPLAFAMGLQNAMRVDVRDAKLATTYVTGTLQVAAQALARATLTARRARREAAGPARRGEASRDRQVGITALGVWVGFLVGAIAGGVLFARAGLAALLLPLGLLLGLVLDSLRPARS
jgi:uncharacterized membrane protein YoaK (UPF0700 family)